MGSLRTLFIKYLSFLFFTGIFHFSYSQTPDLELNKSFSLRWEAHLARKDSMVVHTSVRPIVASDSLDYFIMQELHETEVEKHFAWLFPDKAWIKRKAKWENLYSKRGSDFYFAVNPVFNLEYGRDLANDNLQKFYKNTRGFLINGILGEKVTFSTSFYENQMYVPAYVRAYANDISTRTYTTSWKKEFDIMPGQGRVKTFKQNAYDFAWAEGYIAYSPNKNLNFHFGQGKLFVGDGYRSMLLSDAAFVYPHLKATSRLLKNRIQYTAVYAALQDGYRMRYHSTPEGLYERKGATFFDLNFIAGKKLQIGIFEGTIWKRTSEENQELLPVDATQYNPLILVNTIRFGFAGKNNVLTGIHFRYQPFKKFLVYGQAACDDPAMEKWAWQLGLHWFDAFNNRDLHFQAELNQATRYSYTATTRNLVYGHYNQPLAHPAGGGFFEAVAMGNYRWDDFFVSAKFNYQTFRYYETENQIGKDIYLSDELTSDGGHPNAMAHLFYKEFQYGYIINPFYNMNILIGWLHRSITHVETPHKTSYLYIGFRTSLSNFYYDL